MDTTDFNNNKEVLEKFETPKYEDMNYMEDIIQNAYNENNENDISLLMASSTKMSQNKKYLVRKTAGVQVIIVKFIK